jgi:hypothetical protein
MCEESDNYACKVARTAKDVERLVEEGFDSVTEIDEVVLDRRWTQAHLREWHR